MATHSIFELRRYRLKPGSRERLIDLFDSRLIGPQLATGMEISGEYRDLDDPKSFVWFRSFADMETRAAALDTFYTGPIWTEFGPAANTTMVNSDNVLLLKPAGDSGPFQNSSRRLSAGPAPSDSSVVTISIASLAPRRESDFARFFADEVAPVLARAGARIDAMLVTERSENTFPRLPVREGASVFVWVAAFADQAALDAANATLAATDAWTGTLYPKLDEWLWQPLEVLRLTPTAKSLHRW